MNKLIIDSNPIIASVFENYSPIVRKRLANLRKLIIEVAEKTDGITKLEETLKWGEPSYLTKRGNTVRIDWKPKSPDQYAMYFKCTSRLVPTFKVVYKDTFNYDGNCAIVFKMDETLPEIELKNCIKAALTYHKVKLLPRLGLL